MSSSEAEAPRDLPDLGLAEGHVGERPLLAAVGGWLGEAVFGPDRLAYWQAALESSSKPKAASPAVHRAEEVEAEIGGLERRIAR